MMRKIYLFFTLMLLCCITTYANSPQTNYTIVVQKINQLGDNLIAQYDPKNSLATMDGFSNLYFNHYEGSGMETAVAAISPTVNIKTEALFTQLIGQAANSALQNELQKTWSALKIRLNTDLNLLQSNTANSFTEAFLQSFTILLREGFEALLIVTALLTYLRRSPHADKSHIIHYGVGIALFASVVTAYLFTTILKTMGANREAMEGITMLIASAVLFYVSYWLLAKREAEKWQQFIKQKMSKALTSSNLFALGFAAFLAVYREGAETILFYQALIFNSKGQTLGITAGFIAACFALLLIYRAIRTASFKIPYRLFFTVTALFLYYMAFYFIGGGILELQEAGWVDITPISNFPQITWLGVFPARQNVGAQLIFLIPTLGLLLGWWIWSTHKKNYIASK